MYNWLVVEVFNEIADLLDIKGESSFRSGAYRRAGRALEKLPRDIRELAREAELTDIPGVGSALADKIREIVETGTCGYLERLRDEVPLSLLEFLELPGVGPKTVSTLHKSLGITTVEELEEAARTGRLRNVRGFGKKTEENVLSGIEKLRERANYFLLALAMPLADELASGLQMLAGVQRVEVAGSVRRRKERVGDIDIVAAVSPDKRQAVSNVLTTMDVTSEVLAAGDTKVSVVVKPGVQVDVRMVEDDQFVSTLHHFTGSADHNVLLRGRAKERGYKLNEYGLFALDDGERTVLDAEVALYSILGLDYIPPELREAAGELEAAAGGSLPALVSVLDVRGDMHLHTMASDGNATLEEMANAARERGYQYMVVSDHSQSLVVANGLTLDELHRQWQLIHEYNEGHHGFHVFRGIEVDILGDGALDFPDEVLAELDWVTASIHSRFQQDEETMTKRIVKAMENPHVDAIGHLTGRLLNRRDPYELNIERVVQKAAETGTALELNASPDRLDIDDVVCRQCKEAGVFVVVNTDAHAVTALADMTWGINQARRGWLEPGDIINCLNLDDVLALVKKPKDGRKRN